MNWRLAWMLGIGMGLLMALLVIPGWFKGPAFEFGSWAVVGVISIWFLSRSAKPFLTALVAGVVMGVAQHLAIYALWDTFAANNPQFLEQMQRDAAQMDPKMAMLFGMPFISVAWGLLLGLFSWLAAKLISRGESVATEPPVVAETE